MPQITQMSFENNLKDALCLSLFIIRVYIYIFIYI